MVSAARRQCLPADRALRRRRVPGATWAGQDGSTPEAWPNASAAAFARSVLPRGTLPAPASEGWCFHPGCESHRPWPHDPPFQVV